MTDISSPIAYPPSSSPPVILESRKRSAPNLGDSILSKKRLGSFKLAPTKEWRQSSDNLPIFSLPQNVESLPVSKVSGPFCDDEEEDDSVGSGSLMAGELQDSSQSGTRTTPTSPESEAPVSRASHINEAKTCSGRRIRIGLKKTREPIPFERLIGERSIHETGKAKKSFYGVDIHTLLDEAKSLAERAQANKTSTDSETFHATPLHQKSSKRRRDLLWTEKYRAKKYTDLVGDERTHRDVLRWLKGWDSIVFPGVSRPKPVRKFQEDEEKAIHRKILMLTGPPGLGKTTLAHVCAKQAGYEVLEINASDERSRDVVKGKIKDCVGTDNVKTLNTKNGLGSERKAGRPFCVVVDEVDGVVGGSGGGGEGGFIKALIDLILLDQKNSTALGMTSGNQDRTRGKSEKFRLLRPIILICNDVYHPSLRPLRSSGLAEVIHLRKPPLDKVVIRLKSVLDKEGVSCDSDGVRRLCEATWGVNERKDGRAMSGGAGEGDMRSILVAGEWMASKLRRTKDSSARLSKRWVEDHLSNSSSRGEFMRGIGRGGVKETVERVFQDGAGFARSELARADLQKHSRDGAGDSQGVSEAVKRAATSRLQEIIETSGDIDRIMTDCFSLYPTYSFQDDTFLSKPNAAYDWLHFHDRLSSRVHHSQDWELSPYLSQPVLGFHHLFASSKGAHATDHGRPEDAEEEPSPFAGPRADYTASEAVKQQKSILSGIQSSLSVPLLRSFRSVEDISIDLLPHAMKMLTPNIKPVVVGGSGDQRGVVSIRKESEKEMLQRAVQTMGAVGVRFERVRVDAGPNSMSTYIYRMEP